MLETLEVRGEVWLLPSRISHSDEQSAPYVINENIPSVTREGTQCQKGQGGGGADYLRMLQGGSAMADCSENWESAGRKWRTKKVNPGRRQSWTEAWKSERA